MHDGVRTGRARLGCAVLALLVHAALATSALAQGAVERVQVVAYVGVDGGVLHLLVRTPLSLLDRANFPAAGNRIDLSASQPAARAALAIVRDAVNLWAGGTRLQPSDEAGRLSLPSDREFDSYEGALVHVMTPPAADTEIYARQGLFDAHFQFPVGSADSRFVLRAAFAPDPSRAPVLTVHYRPQAGTPRSFVVSGRADIALDPTKLGTAADFLGRGARRIASAPIHVLFLIGLLLPLRRTRDRLAAVSVFVGGHSVAFIGTAWAVASPGEWFAPLAATLAAATVFGIAVRNALFPVPLNRWLMVAACGIAHGLAFSSAFMPDRQFAGPHVSVAALSFDAGIVAGEAAALVVLAAALPWLTRLGVQTGRGVLVVSALLGQFASHRLSDEATALWQQDWPALNAPELLSIGRWVAIVLIAIGAAKAVERWIVRAGARRAGEGLSS